jgi:hypothetical protein
MFGVISGTPNNYSARRERSVSRRASFSCAEHDRQLGGGSPLSSLMAAKD